MEPNKSGKIPQVAILVSLACVLQISESLIPHPIPGLRLGLANMLTLTALVLLGFKYAIEIAILRTILSSFIMGTFMSPTFILSFSGSVLSTLIMGLFFWLSSLHNHLRLSIVGISIIGAFSHNMVQLYLAYLVLVRNEGIFVFLPWLGIGAVVTGWIIGLVASGVCRKVKEVERLEIFENLESKVSPPALMQYASGDSVVHRLPAHIKIASVFFVALVVLIFDSYWLYFGLLFSLASIAALSHTSFLYFYSQAKRYFSLVVAAFLLPIFFNSGTEVLYTIADFNVTQEGFYTGALFASRILFLILFSSLLMRTTSPEEMTQGLAKVLLPLRYAGVSEKRIATILSMAWMAIPFLWEAARTHIRTANLKKPMKLREMIPLLSNLIATLYLETESENSLFNNSSVQQDQQITGHDNIEDSSKVPTHRTGGPAD